MKADRALRIGELATQSGVPAKTIRYYESVKLLKAAQRSSNGYRVYGERDLRTLRFVRSARQLGFCLDEVRALLALWEDKGRPSREVKALAEHRIQEIDARVQDLLALKAELQRLTVSCHGDDRPDCPILESLEHGGLSGFPPRADANARDHACASGDNKMNNLQTVNPLRQEHQHEHETEL